MVWSGTMSRNIQITSTAGNGVHCLTEHGTYGDSTHIDLGSFSGRERFRITGTMGGASIQLGTVYRLPNGTLVFFQFFDADAGPHGAPIEKEIAVGMGKWLGAQVTGASETSNFRLITAMLS
jgi:hypothetical protein